MDRHEMVCRLKLLNDKLFLSCCYDLYHPSARYGKTFDWKKKCRAYQRAVKVLEDRLGI